MLPLHSAAVAVTERVRVKPLALDELYARDPEKARLIEQIIDDAGWEFLYWLARPANPLIAWFAAHPTADPDQRAAAAWQLVPHEIVMAMREHCHRQWEGR